MSNPRQTLLCRYHYTPLDQLAACTVTAQPSSQRFYLKERLSTEIQGALQHSIMQHEDQLLAQHQRQADTLETRMIATDQQRSVLALLDTARLNNLRYSPYGHRIAENGLLSLLGFNGERPDPVTGHYLLGNGYRAFNPVLMRFNSPDSWSPFGRGGLNAYGYCVGDPVNQTDPSGHGIYKLLSRVLSRSSSGSTQELLGSFDNLTDLQRSLSNISEAPANTPTKPFYRTTRNELLTNTKDALAGNKAKLKNTQLQIENLKNHPDRYIKNFILQTPAQYGSPISPRSSPTAQARFIKVHGAQLLHEQTHYVKKIKKLELKAAKVRDPIEVDR